MRDDARSVVCQVARSAERAKIDDKEAYAHTTAELEKAKTELRRMQVVGCVVVLQHDTLRCVCFGIRRHCECPLHSVVVTLLLCFSEGGLICPLWPRSIALRIVATLFQPSCVSW